jgi:iron(III) transport system substrate-binding protein
MRVRARTVALAAGFLAVALTTAGCGGASEDTTTDVSDATAQPPGDTTLTLYNAQHESLMQELVAGFTEETGIEVEMRNGDDFEMANQIVAEGDKSPADVFVTENSPAMTLVASKGGFAPIDDATLEQVPAEMAPDDGSWVGFAARSTVLAYNTTKLQEANLPQSILDLADPTWQGRIGFSPAGADFQAIVSAVLAEQGEDATLEWLKGLKANGKVYQGNSKVMQAVNAGEIDAGVIYHYYWFKDQAESGENSNNTELYYFGSQDPGAFVSVSGAGVLKASDNQEEAQQLVKYLTGEAGQTILAESDSMEYPIGKQAPANPELKPLNELEAPTVELSSLNGPKVVELMQEAGLL